MGSKKASPEHHLINFPVVGIGASAGGLGAFRKFLRNIPPNSGMAYILVQHLAPAHESLLPEILANETGLPVHQIADDINIAPDHIYIIPENKMLTVYDGKLKLDPREKGRKLNLVIDTFFNSLAEVHTGFARGVVLSGTGYDGTLGLKTIKEMGGSTFVQNPESAAYDGMPLSAIRAGAADFILDVEEIPQKLHDLDSAYESSNAYADEDMLSTKGDEFYKSILRLLKLKTGNDFTHYKQATIRRRIARRMVMTKREDTEAYLDYLRTNKQEQLALFNDILIPVSYFFRDSNIFSLLCENAFPRILDDKRTGENIRVWIAGCSTGEEAYSMAISLHEFLGERIQDYKVQIFATDISENVISKARTGIYSRQEILNIPEERLNNYFTKIESAYHIKKEIRDMCIFAVHNFTKDPPFAKMDIISCRNVLIYLDPFLQNKTFSTFHYSLRPNGILFLGKSETAGTSSNLFEPLLKGQKIYARKNTSESFVPAPYKRFENEETERQSEPRKKSYEPDFQRKANELLFTKYTPAGVIINNSREIIHFHGETGQFLSQPPGKPNFNVFKMLRPDLVFELRAALLKVKTDNEAVVKEQLALKGENYLVSLEVIPLENKGEEGHILILFHKLPAVADDRIAMSKRKNAQSERIRQLEAEIEQMRQDIRKVTEEQEVANEELQSANEELLSNSEELQTLNEELETSTEELRSNNEELTTINDELIDRQEQLTTARLYAEAIIQTIREPLVILNKEFSVKSANAAFYKYLQTNEQDTEGKIIFDLRNVQWHIGDLKGELTRALQDKVTVEGLEVKIRLSDKAERTMLLNIRPILSDALGEPLLLLAIEDITEIRAANITLQYNNRQLLESNKELTSFNYIASHDLQEPLRKIHTFGKMILKDGNSTISEEAATFLERILVSVRRMQQLTDDLLNYSHLNNSDVSDFENTDLGALVNEVIEELSESILAAGATVTVARLPVVSAHPLMMRQLFMNLLSNALKYRSADNAPVIRVSSSLTDKNDMEDSETRFHKISIADNGIGFAQEQSQRIFEPFQRLHGKDKYEGTGIGLAICGKIAFKHNGYITAEGTPGKGATFNVFLPVP